MTDTDRGLHQAAEQIFSLCRPETCVKLQSRTTYRAQHHCHSIPLHSAVRTSAMVFIVTCMYFLSPVVGYASCSQSHTVRPADVAPNSFGTFNFKELEEIVYDIEILKVPVPEPLTDLDGVHNINKDSDEGNGGGDVEPSIVPGGGGESEEQSDETEKADDIKTTHSEDVQHLVLLSKYGQKYLCTLPQDTMDAGSNSSDLENETKANSFNVSALLHPLTKQPCLTKNTGWWTYEYCHGDYIRQYHSEAAKTVKNLWIGYYQNETVWTQEEISKAKERIESLRGKLSNFQIHHSVHYVNGTTCDLTGKLRRATVKIFCSLHGEERLVSVQELETCDYVLHVETPLLCKQRLFDVASVKKPHPLSCSPLVSQEEFQQYTEKQERLKLEKEQRLKEEAEKLAARKRGSSSGRKENPARKKYMTISDLLDPNADVDEITAQVREEITVRKAGSRGGVELNKNSVGSTKSKSNFGLFDSGADDQEQEEDEDDEDDEDEVEDDEEELQNMAERFGKDVLEGLMKGLASQMSDWAKEKEPSLKNAWERAIKKTQQTIAKLADVKENGEKKLRLNEASKLEDFRENEEEKRVSSEPTLQPEKLRTKDGNGLNNKANHQEHLKNENVVPSKEEQVKDTELLGEKIKQMVRLNQEALNKRQQADIELDTDDLEVEEEGVEGEGEDVLDEESLAELGEDITKEVQKQLDDIGLGNLGNNVQVKVFTLPNNMLHELLDDEEEDIDDNGEDFDDEDGDQEELDAYGNRKESTTEESSSYVAKDLPARSSVGFGSHSAKSGRKKGKRDNSEVKVISVKLNEWFPLSESEDGDSDDDSSKGARGKLQFASLIEHFMNPMTEERKKVKELESNYERIWEDIDGEETNKRKVE